jgi:hypothetical protein
VSNDFRMKAAAANSKLQAEKHFRNASDIGATT